MRHFSYTGGYYRTKNRLEKALEDLLRNKNRQVIESKELGAFKNDMLRSIEELNILHPRCNPIKASWSLGYSSKDDFHLDGVFVCQFYLYAEQLINHKSNQ